MKSIANQYKALKEGRMSQFNFMRNLRMSMPQVTNTTSFGDAVKILKNKGIIAESVVDEEEVFSQGAQDEYNKVGTDGYDNVSEEEEKESNDDAEFDALLKKIEDEMHGEEAVKAQYDMYGSGGEEPKEGIDNAETLNEAVNDSGKKEYAKFSEAENDNFNELLDGITIEHECYPAKTYDEIVKIVTKNLKKDPFYYTMYKLTGTPGNKPQTMDASKPETHQMKYVTGEESYTDKARGMKPVKDVEKFKADKTKATKAKAKGVEVDVFAIVAKSQRGIPKMKPLGEKMKNVVVKDTAEKKKLKENKEEADAYWHGLLKDPSLPEDVKKAVAKWNLGGNIDDLRPVRDLLRKHGIIQKYAELAKDNSQTPASKVASRIFSSPQQQGLSKEFEKGTFKEQLTALVREILAEETLPSKEQAAKEITAKAINQSFIWESYATAQELYNQWETHAYSYLNAPTQTLDCEPVIHPKIEQVALKTMILKKGNHVVPRKVAAWAKTARQL